MTKDGTHILSLENGYHLWSRTDGTGKPIKLLTLHGGPGAGHEPYERFPEFLNPDGVEVTQYDQLGLGILINQILMIRLTLNDF